MRIVLAVVVLSACASLDPYTRPGTWRPLEANATNLRAMLADPADLARGTDAPGSDGELAAAAVDRLRTDQVKPLPDSAVADVKPIPSGAAAPATPAPAAPPVAVPIGGP